MTLILTTNRYRNKSLLPHPFNSPPPYFANNLPDPKVGKLKGEHCIMFPPSQQFCLNKMLLLSKLLSLSVDKSSAFMGREVTGTDLRSHQSHIPKQNVTLQGVIIHHDHNHIVIGCLIKHTCIKCFRIILLYIKGMMT